MEKIKIKKLHKDAVIPSYAKEGDAGLDMTATRLQAYNGHVEIMGSDGSNYESLYVGGNIRTKSLTVQVDGGIDPVNTNRCSFIYTAGGDVTLPSDAPSGSMFFIKSYYAAANVKAPTGMSIMNAGNTNLVSSMNIGGESAIFIKADNSTWVTFYCG